MVGGAEGQGTQHGPGDPNGPEGHQGLGGVGGAGASVAGAPDLVQEPHNLGPCRDTLLSLGRQDLVGPVATLRLGWVDKPYQGQVAMLPRGQQGMLGRGLMDMLHRDMVGMCRPWPEDQEANISICILFEER